MTLSYAGEKQEAINILQKAIALSPRNPWYTGNLASAYLQAQDFDHAIPLLQELRTSTEPGIASMAAQQLRQVEAYRSAVSGQRSQSGNIQTAVQTVKLNHVPDGENSQGDGQSVAEKRINSGSNDPVLFMKGVLGVSGLFRRASGYAELFRPAGKNGRCWRRNRRSWS